MQAGSLVDGDVRALTSRVVVAGVTRAHSSWSFDRNLVGDLPDQVAGGSGVSQATGTIVWAELPDVTDMAANPWNSGVGWLPQPGDPVQILVSDGVTEWVQFTGVIDDAAGDVGGLPQSRIVDTVDRLNRPFVFDSLLRVMPPTTVAAPAYRGVGLTALYLADQAMRGAGFFATPKTEANPAVSVPAQTSMWPDGGQAGTLTLAGSADGSASHAINTPAPWGWAVSNFNCTYAPRLSNPGTTPVQMTVMVAPDHAGTFTFDANYGSTRVTLWVNSARTAVFSLNGANRGTLPLGSDTLVSLLIEGGVWTLRKADGGQVSGTISMPSAAMSSVQMVGDTRARVAGFQVSHPSSPSHRFASLSHTPSARVEAGYLTGIVDALPAVKTTARDFLDELGAATLAPYWVDELGILNAAESWYLRNRTPVQTISTQDDIFSLSWSNTLLGVRSQVDVNYKIPAVSKNRWPNITLYQGSGETMEAGQVSEEFIGPGSDEAWIQVDTSLDAPESIPAAFNSALGSFGGGVFQNDATGATSSGGSYITTTLARIQGATYKLATVIGALPANTKALLKTKDLVAYHPDMRGFSLPVIRGYGKVQWADATVTSSYLGPAAAPALAHDVGPWVSRLDDTTAVQRIADFIGEQVSVARPTISGMSVAYDPRRQLGDMIRITSPNLLGVNMTALVVSVSNSASGRYEQKLDVRVISASTTFTTYEQFERAHPDTLSYGQWRLLFPDSATYSSFNSDPLRGATL